MSFREKANLSVQPFKSVKILYNSHWYRIFRVLLLVGICTFARNSKATNSIVQFCFTLCKRCRLQHSFRSFVAGVLDPHWFQCGSGSRVWPKIWKKYTAGQQIYFLIKNFFIDLHKGRPTYRRSLQPSKENIQHFKTSLFSIFVGHFCPPGSGSGSSVLASSVPPPTNAIYPRLWHYPRNRSIGLLASILTSI